MARTKRGAGSDPARLRPVGVSDDGTALLLARRANARGSFRLDIDEDLVAQLDRAKGAVDRALAGAVEPEPAVEEAEQPAPPPPSPKLTIKEVQVLLRQGKSVTSVARKAGVDASWVERFEGPVVWERAGMAQRAQRATLYRARMGQSGATLGESVQQSLRSRRVQMDAEEFAGAWDSVKRSRGGRWVVSFRYLSRGRSRTAQWEFDPSTGKLRALDSLAAELGWIPPSRKRRFRARP